MVSLVASTLSGKLQQIATSFPATYQAAGQAWANAYADYAGAAISPIGGAPLGISAAKATMAATLAAGFAAQPAPVAPVIGAALLAFWMAPPMTFSGAFPGVVTVVGGAAAVGPALAAAFASNIASKAAVGPSCDAIAAAIHTFTLTVVVTHATIPSPTVGPIS